MRDTSDIIVRRDGGHVSYGRRYEATGGYSLLESCAGPDDSSPRFRGDSDARRCPSCWSGVSHTEDFHAAQVARFDSWGA